MEVLYLLLDQGLRDDELYPAIVIFPLDVMIQQALVVPHTDVGGLGCG